MEFQSVDRVGLFQEKYGLTVIEMRILDERKLGLTYKMIAEKLNLSPHTVNTHMENILRKLDVHTSAAAITKFFTELGANNDGGGQIS